MQKILFNDQYGLTQAVIDGRKTMTRRIITGRLATLIEKYEEESKKGLLLIPRDVIPDNMSLEEFVKAWKEYKSSAVVQIAEENATKIQPLNDEKMKEFFSGGKYKVGEVVAVAQSYKTLGYTKQWVEQHITPNPNAKPTDPFGLMSMVNTPPVGDTLLPVKPMPLSSTRFPAKAPGKVTRSYLFTHLNSLNKYGTKATHTHR